MSFFATWHSIKVPMYIYTYTHIEKRYNEDTVIDEQILLENMFSVLYWNFQSWGVEQGGMVSKCYASCFPLHVVFIFENLENSIPISPSLNGTNKNTT